VGSIVSFWRLLLFGVKPSLRGGSRPPPAETQKPDSTSEFPRGAVPIRDFQFVQPILTANTRKSDRPHRSSTPAGPVKLCLLHRQENEGVELCSVSRQTPIDHSRPPSQAKILHRTGAEYLRRCFSKKALSQPPVNWRKCVRVERTVAR
jgi:hypothetical protein